MTPEEYARECRRTGTPMTVKGLFGTSQPDDCENCSENRHDTGADRRLPCGQQNCWIRLHLGSGFPEA
ncbi:MAG: hypothetical protein NC311_14795 [Muribaculaceae bacterium]|nr:hypothetical protein [Muribaculaceae bacterium]